MKSPVMDQKELCDAIDALTRDVANLEAQLTAQGKAVPQRPTLSMMESPITLGCAGDYYQTPDLIQTFDAFSAHRATLAAMLATAPASTAPKKEPATAAPRNLSLTERVKLAMANQPKTLYPKD
jgi:hypothetical protein